MKDEELNKKLTKIGYSKKWLDFGVLTLNYLMQQEQIIESLNDQNAEHYRYETLKQYLSSKQKLSDQEFDNYLNLTLNDEDIAIGYAATIDLFKIVDLSDSQFQSLCESIGHFGASTIKVVKRQILLRKINKNKLTNELFIECIENGDSVVHDYVLGIADIKQLEVLTKSGINKRLRNLATQKLDKLTREINSR